MEEGDPGTAAEGVWRAAVRHRSAFHGRGAILSRSGSYTFVPNLAAPGLYRVSMWWPVVMGLSPRVPVAIQTAAGPVEEEVDQSAGGGQWSPVGVYRLDSTARVRLEAWGPLWVAADAMLFEPAVPPASPGGLLARPAAGGLALDWDDGEAGLTYTVYRRCGGEEAFSAVAWNLAESAYIEAAGGWRLEAGGWRLATGGWRLATGDFAADGCAFRVTAVDASGLESLPSEATLPRLHRLSVTVKGEGTVSVEPPGGAHLPGQEVSLTAAPAPGQRFLAWGGGLLGSENPVRLVMTSDVPVEASFAPLEPAPAIAGVEAAAGDRAASIAWSTDQPASSLLHYGRTPLCEEGAVECPELKTSHNLLVTGLSPDTRYYFSLASSNEKGEAASPAPMTFLTAATPLVAPSGIRSDDFNVGCLALQGFWTRVDARGDCRLTVEGAGTSQAQLRFDIPAGRGHDLWSDGDHSPRILQAAPNANFEVEVKFTSAVTRKHQGQGILVVGTGRNVLRFDFVNNGTGPKIFAAAVVNGVASTKVNKLISTSLPLHMRVRRQGNGWTQTYSQNGRTWTTGGTFSHAMSVASVGVHALNAGTTSSNAPAHTALVDYFFNTAFPIAPEDGKLLGGGTATSLTVEVVGLGTVARSPDQQSYSCGQEVTLTATAGPGSLFSGWSGDLSGQTSPARIAMTADRRVVATFLPDVGPPLIQGVRIAPGESSAVLSWTTDQPATGRVEYGLGTGYELGAVEDATLSTSHNITLAGLTPGTLYHYRLSAAGSTGKTSTTPDQSFTTSSPPPAWTFSLSWDPPTENADGTPLVDLAGFKVYVRAPESTFPLVMDVGMNTEWTPGGLAAGTYGFRVSAYDTAQNESVLTDEIVEEIP